MRPHRVWLSLAIGLAAAASLAAAPAPPASDPTRIEYEGTVYFEGHYKRPGEVRPYHSRQVFSTNGRGSTRVDWTTWADGDSAPTPETVLIIGRRVFHRGAPGRPWRERAADHAREERLQACAGLPAELERMAAAESDPRGEWRRSGGRVQRYLRRIDHPRLGDVRDSVVFTYTGAERAPTSLAVAQYQRDATWRVIARRTDSSTAPQPESLFSMPETFEPPSPSEDHHKLSAAPPLTPVAPGLWSVDLNDVDSRTLIVEFADHLAVIEAAVGSANGERIVDAARRQWPDKPIRYALFSHYHPHYTGGLRALMAEGATVVTTRGNEAFVRGVSNYPFEKTKDRLARRPRPARVLAFAGRHELADSTNRLVAIDYGDRSQHTDEFVLFWFPRQKLMFEAEHGWFQLDGAVRSGRRAKALLAWIAEQGLDVERFVQCWPMNDTRATMTRAELDSLVNAPR